MPRPRKPNPKAAPATPAPQTAKPLNGMAAAGNVVACVGVGGLLGYGADLWFGSQPWGLIGGLFLGFAAWLRELWGLLNPKDEGANLPQP